MHSLHADKIPWLTFVGRPLDPNKGLVTFFDALELLIALPQSPRFGVWLIGGDEEEVVSVRRLIAARPQLAREARDGRLYIWGRVEHDALPEFYGRSFVTVVPSYREQFGLVAIEAMMCGCPVIASRQGGLADTVLPGVTGTCCEIDHPQAFASALLLYLRNPALRVARGTLAREWAITAFDLTRTYKKISELYARSPENLDTLQWSLPDDYAHAIVATKIEIVERLLNDHVQSWELLQHRYHVVAQLKLAHRLLVLKVFRDRPSLSAAMFPVGRFCPQRSSADFVDNAVFHAQNSLLPRLVAFDRAAGLAIYEKVSGESKNPSDQELHAVVDGFAAYGQSQNDRLESDSYRHALETFLRQPDENGLMALDDASISVNRVAQNIKFGLRATHPCAELFRVLISSEQAGWPIPSDVNERLRAVVRLALARPTPPHIPLRLCHGDLKSRHILTSGSKITAIDSEHSVYASGGLDFGTWGAKAIAAGQNVFDVLTRFHALQRSEHEETSAIQWLIYYLAHAYLARIHHGKHSIPTQRIRRFLADLSLALS